MQPVAQLGASTSSLSRPTSAGQQPGVDPQWAAAGLALPGCEGDTGATSSGHIIEEDEGAPLATPGRGPEIFGILLYESRGRRKYISRTRS